MLVESPTCPLCQGRLNSRGDCLSCLLRVGLFTAADPALLAAVPPVFGDFQIERRADGSLWELGRGAMGVTYRAKDTLLLRTVALKVVETPDGSGRSPKVRERFMQEARDAASLHHPNVADVFQFGTSPETDHAYYAMELIDGETLEERVRRDGDLQVGVVLEIAIQVARALAAATDQGLVHRDLKPGNIMLSRDAAPATMRVTIIDFGLAQATAAAEGAARLTRGGFVGTPAFASPEQFRGEPVDGRSDIYSLGVTMWYALTGQMPFAEKTVARIGNHPARTALPFKQLRARSVPPRVVAVLRSALAVDPAARPATARVLLADLEACRGRRFGRPAQVVLAVALAAVTGVLWWTHGPSRPTPPTASAVMDKSVAVLPFDAFSKDADSERFAAGVQSEVLTDLAHIADLKVISPRVGHAVRETPKEAQPARDRHASWAVALRRRGQRAARGRQDPGHRAADRRAHGRPPVGRALRPRPGRTCSPSRVTSRTPSPGSFRRSSPLRNRPRWKRCPPTTNRPTSFTCAPWHGPTTRCSSWTLPKTRKTIELLRLATARDPNFVRAFALMAEVHAMTYLQTRAVADGEKARAAAEVVARLRPGSAVADETMACYDYLVRHEYVRAHDEFTRVLDRLPNDARAYYYLALIERRQGRWKEAVEHNRRALELDPENNLVFKTTATLLSGLQRYPELLTLIDRRIASHPAMFALHVRKAGLLLDWKADTRAARAELADLPPGAARDDSVTEQVLTCDYYERDFAAAARDLATYPEDEVSHQSCALEEGNLARYRGDARAAAADYNLARPIIEADVSEHAQDFNDLGALAELDAHLGHKETALAEMRGMHSLVPPSDKLQDPMVTYECARVLTFTGDHEGAIHTLQTICGLPFGPIYGDLRANPDWDGLRGDPRFEAMVTSLAPK